MLYWSIEAGFKKISFWRNKALPKIISEKTKKIIIEYIYYI